MDIDFKKLNIVVQPQILAAVLKLKDEDIDMSFKDLEKYLKSDQNMAAMILKVSNSAFYNRGNKITTLEHAIAILGFKLVHSLALVLTTKSIFDGGNYSRFKRLVWEHSVITGIMARKIAERCGKKALLEEAFVGGLLHDIGKSVLNAVDRKKFISVLDLVTNDHKSFTDASVAIFSYNHMEVGLEAAKVWNFPELFLATIGWHERLGEHPTNISNDSKDILYIVAYANYLANEMGFGVAQADLVQVAIAAEKYLGKDEEERKYYLEIYKNKIKQEDLYKSFFSLS